MKLHLIISLFVMIFLYSCENIFHPEAEIPSFIKIQKIDLIVSDPYIQGTASNKIVDAWVYVDDDLVGVYELPAAFPVLKEGKHSLKIKAGIKDNGIAATRVQYPFFDFYTDNSLSLFIDSTVVVNPTVEYYSSTKFSWLEAFEDPGITIDSVSPSSGRMKRSIDILNVFEGNASGYFSLDAANNIFKGVSNESFDLPKEGADVYLELNYKTTANLDVYIISNNSGVPKEEFVLRISPSNKNGIPEWNKIYVNLSSNISGNPGAADYKISFFSNISNDGITSAEIYLDNIKLVHL